MDVRQMKGRQESMDTKLITMKRENEALWRELASLRQKHAKQTQIVSKVNYKNLKAKRLHNNITLISCLNPNQSIIFYVSDFTLLCFMFQLLQFLVGMMSQQTPRLAFKRRMPLMLNDKEGVKQKLSRTDVSLNLIYIFAEIH